MGVIMLLTREGAVPSTMNVNRSRNIVKGHIEFKVRSSKFISSHILLEQHQALKVFQQNIDCEPNRVKVSFR
jgi:hypothetical protein